MKFHGTFSAILLIPFLRILELLELNIICKKLDLDMALTSTTISHDFKSINSSSYKNYEKNKFIKYRI